MFTCFVVGPFGASGSKKSEIDLHLEREGLKRQIFAHTAEVCREAGFPVSIEYGDKLPAFGPVGGDTARRIDEADVVIVVATTSSKPNVWIEFGWASGFWQEAIILQRRGFTLPTDIDNPISEFYSLKQARGEDPEGARETASKLAARIVVRLRSPTRTKRFDHLRRGLLASGAIRVYRRFSHALDFNEWSAMIDAAEEEIIIASPRMLDIMARPLSRKSTSSKESATAPPIRNFLLQKALEDKVRVTILLQHPDNYSRGHLVRDGMDAPERIRSDLETSYAKWAQTVREYRLVRQASEKASNPMFPTSVEDGFRVIQIRDRYLPYRVTLTEKRAITTLRFYTESVNSGLCIDSMPSSEDVDPYDRPFYEQIREELAFLIKENRQTSDLAYQAFLNTGGEAA